MDTTLSKNTSVVIYRSIIMFKVDNEIKAYWLGFLQTDGTLRHKSMSIEIAERDKHILEAFKTHIGGTITSRTRNIKIINKAGKSYDYKKYVLFRWQLCSVDLVKQINKIGIPCGKKSDILKPLSVPKKLEQHYIRGLIDGDGSICISGNNIPIIGVVVSSEDMKNYFCQWFKSLGIETNPKRNKRDNIYNIAVRIENAQKVCGILYGDCNYSLIRKLEIAQKIIQWKRPLFWKKITWKVKDWSQKED